MADYFDDDYFFNATCHSVGMSGGCGYDCPVFRRGNCEIQDEMLEAVDVDDVNLKRDLIEWGLIEEEQVNAFDAFDAAMEILNDNQINRKRK